MIIDHVMSAEMIQIISRPMRRDVALGNTASFNCVGYGSYLDITWRFDFPPDEQVMCSREICDHTALTYSERPSSDNLIMNTTLEIDTSQLELGVYSILCILQQSISQNIDLEKGMDQPFSTTMTIVEPSKSDQIISRRLVALVSPYRRLVPIIIISPYRRLVPIIIVSPYRRPVAIIIVSPYRRLVAIIIVSPYRRPVAIIIVSPYRRLVAIIIISPYRRLVAIIIVSPYRRLVAIIIVSPYRRLVAIIIVSPYRRPVAIIIIIVSPIYSNYHGYCYYN